MWVLASVLSGAIWTWLLFLLGPFQHLGIEFSVGAGPIIGIIMGLAIWPLRDLDDWVPTILVSLLGLYVATALFGIAVTISGLIDGRFEGIAEFLTSVLGAVFFWCWGLTMSGSVALLWPVSIANHALIWWLQRRCERAPNSR